MLIERIKSRFLGSLGCQVHTSFCPELGEDTQSTIFDADMRLVVLCTGVAIYSLGDMMVYNRRKRREFFAEQEKNYNIALARAYDAEARGVLTPDLALVLNKERAVLLWEEMQKEKKGVVKGAKDWLFGSFSKQERPGGAMGFASDEIKRIAEGRFREEGQGVGSSGVSGGVAGGGREVEPNVSESQLMVNKAAIKKRLTDVQQVGQPHGGLLDQVGQEAAEGVKNTSKSWWDWARRR